MANPSLFWARHPDYRHPAAAIAQHRGYILEVAPLSQVDPDADPEPDGDWLWRVRTVAVGNEDTTVGAGLAKNARMAKQRATEVLDKILQSRGRRASLVQNGGEPTKAIRMFRRFHTRDWRHEGDFHPDLEIPEHVELLGAGVKTDYRSDKLNPTDGQDEGWIDYTHDHDAGVRMYRPVRGGGDVLVPAWIRNVSELTWLGKCLGLSYRDDRGTHEAPGTEPLPELYAIPSGKALVVIQGKRSVVALIWGGRLGVERRGIVH